MPTDTGTPAAPDFFGLGLARKKLHENTQDFSLTKGPNYEDADSKGADLYINKGVRWLELQTPGDFYAEEREYTLAANGFNLNIDNCKEIIDVRLRNTDGEKWLTPNNYRTLRDLYPKPYTSLNVGTPAYWARDERPALASDYGKIRLVLMPPADTAQTVVVFAAFYSSTLESFTDRNIWTERWPDLLSLAAQREWALDKRNDKQIDAIEKRFYQHLKGIESGRISEEVIRGEVFYNG